MLVLNKFFPVSIVNHYSQKIKRCINKSLKYCYFNWFFYWPPLFILLIVREKCKHNIRRIAIFSCGKVKCGFYEKLNLTRLPFSFRLRNRNFLFNSPPSEVFELFYYCTKRLTWFLCMFILSPWPVSFCSCYCNFLDFFIVFFSNIL